MFFTPSFVSAFMMLSSVRALPHPDQGGQIRLAFSEPCPAGSYWYKGTETCTSCLPGSYCDGTSGEAKLCSPGYYQPNVNSTACLPTPAGYYTNTTGSAVATPCYPGSFQPYTAQDFCYSATSGRFQSKPGQAVSCYTCCGWASSRKDYNINPTNCTDPKANANIGSGDGCISRPTACTRATTCQQSADGACPAGNSTDKVPW
ncbi:hypothetical protein GGX14DRAFT_602554 [Mycena pura]|uniref:Tyrosine-protein kinase ephrin type A/B receptor-like domain-containing protein n=1 Tax=Mycena pura TaxID=153505 RepID=A0AAD6VNA2_9AGAR|nr:hypothetical protein GGX14DRAFT_602554 [Mycena pura]